MRRSKTLARWRSGEVARFCSLGHSIPAFVRHAAHFGFDCIWVDLEHRIWDDRDVQSLMAFFHLFDIDAMVRPPTLEKTRLYRYLEDGATGLMIPHVSTPEKAQMLVDAVKFPPLGDRGLDGAGLDADFYVGGAVDYPEEANRETFLIVQIETLQAVENVDAIAAIPGVEGFFVGPGDLGMRIARAETSLTLAEARRRVAQAAERHGKIWGQPASSPDQVKQLADEGAKLIAYGGDFWAFFKMLEQSSRDFDEILGKKS